MALLNSWSRSIETYEVIRVRCPAFSGRPVGTRPRPAGITYVVGLTKKCPPDSRAVQVNGNFRMFLAASVMMMTES